MIFSLVPIMIVIMITVIITIILLTNIKFVRTLTPIIIILFGGIIIGLTSFTHGTPCVKVKGIWVCKRDSVKIKLFADKRGNRIYCMVQPILICENKLGENYKQFGGTLRKGSVKKIKRSRIKISFKERIFIKGANNLLLIKIKSTNTGSAIFLNKERHIKPHQLNERY